MTTLMTVPLGALNGTGTWGVLRNDEMQLP